MSEVPRAINNTNKIERDNDWIGELMNPARIKAIKAPVIASFSGCLSMFLNPENRTETMRPINNNVPMIPVPVAS